MDMHTVKYDIILIAGHTKFAPDGCFGLLKKAYKKNACFSLD